METIRWLKYIVKEKDVELQYNLVAECSDLVFKSYLCPPVTHDTWHKLPHLSVPQFLYQWNRNVNYNLNLPQLVESCKCIDTSQHLEQHLTHSEHSMTDGD